MRSNVPGGRRQRNSSAKKEAEKQYAKRQSIYEGLCIILILSLMFFGGLCLLFLKRPTFSEIEKRELAKCPEFTLENYFSGNFTDEFSAFFSDTVPFREQIVELASSLESLKGISTPKFYGNVNIVADDEGNAVTTAPTTEITVSEPPADNTEPDGSQSDNEADNTSPEVTEPAVSETEAETTAEEEEFNGDIGEFSNNGIIVDSVKMYGDNAGVMLFGGNKAMGTRYAELISQYKQALGEDVNVYNIVVPTSVEFYLPKKFNKYSSSEKDAIDHIYSSYTADVIPIDAYTEISQHTDEYIYLRTDHHWSQRGAYYAYAALVKAMGETPKDIDADYVQGTKEGYVGSLYGYTNDPVLKNSPETFTYYLPQGNYRTWYYDYATLEPIGEGPLIYENTSPQYAYGMFLGSDAIHTKVVTENNTGRKVCVFKESYGNAFVPFLTDSFDEIYVIDIRYFGRNAVDYMKEKGITDVIFINNAFAANTSKLIDGIEKLFTNPFGTLSDEKLAEIYPDGVPTVTTAVSEPPVTEVPDATEAVSETVTASQ